MWTVIQLALKGGFKTSEFWLAVLGLAVTAGAPAIQAKIDALHAVASSGHGSAAIVAAVGAAVISGAYSLARAMTKKGGLDAAAAATTAAATPSGNTVSPGPGSASLEEAHRSAVVAATSALAVAQRALEQASNIPRPATFPPAAAPAAVSPQP